VEADRRDGVVRVRGGRVRGMRGVGVRRREGRGEEVSGGKGVRPVSEEKLTLVGG